MFPASEVLQLFNTCTTPTTASPYTCSVPASPTLALTFDGVATTATSFANEGDAVVTTSASSGAAVVSAGCLRGNCVATGASGSLRVGTQVCVCV